MDDHDPDYRLARRPDTGLLTPLRQVFGTAWDPRPVPKPVVDPSLPGAPFLLRVAEVLRYHLLLLEYSLSRGGGLRAWLKLNLLLALLLLIPVVLVVPVVTALLEGLATWTALLLQIVSNLVQTVLWALALVVLLATALSVLNGLRARRQRPPQYWDQQE